MYYQFNNFTGRLVGAHCTPTPYYPISATPLNKSESPKIVFESSRVKIAQETPPRRMSSKTIPGTNQAYGEVPESVKAKMRKFQIADGVPVHLKGGPMDKILFGVTLALCVIGVGMTLQNIYVMSFPKKK